MNYAVIKTGGKQYRVSQGDIIPVESLKGLKEGDNVDFSDVLLVRDGDELKIGNPTLDLKVTGKIKEITKAEKIHVYKYKSKSRYRRKTGHRQIINNVEITGFGKSSVKANSKSSSVKKTA